MFNLQTTGFSRVRFWFVSAAQSMGRATRGALTGAHSLAKRVFRFGPPQPAPKPSPATPARIALQPVRRIRSVPRLRDAGALRDAQAALRPKRRQSVPASAAPTLVACGGGLRLYLSPDDSLRALNRARYIDHLGLPVREGGLPPTRLDLAAAAEALQIHLRIWHADSAQAHPGFHEAFAPCTPGAPCVDLMCERRQGADHFSLFDPVRGNCRRVGDEGESLYACLSYALDVDDFRAHRAAFEAVCACRGADYMAFIEAFLPPRSSCIADLRQRVAHVLRQDPQRYGPLIDEAIRDTLQHAKRSA